jgi:acyl-CoA thioester hydrolase
VETFTRSFVVRWSDCDANGHLRNTCYSEYAIEVRWAYLTQHGFGHATLLAQQLGPVLLREEVDYRRECHMGEELAVDFKLLGLSEDGARFRMSHRFLKPGGKLAARLVVLGGWFDLAARKLVLPPPPLRALLTGLERDEDFEPLPKFSRR